MKITDMQIKVRKETTKEEPHTFKSSFAFKLEKETNENVTTKKQNNPNNRTKPNCKTKMKITTMHIKVSKETTKAEPHTFKSSFAFKLEKETNQNDTTTTNGIAQNPQTTCQIKE